MNLHDVPEPREPDYARLERELRVAWADPPSTRAAELQRWARVANPNDVVAWGMERARDDLGVHGLTPPRARDATANFLVADIMRFRTSLMYANVSQPLMAARYAFMVSRAEYDALRAFAGRYDFESPVLWDASDGTMRVYGITVIPR